MYMKKLFSSVAALLLSATVAVAQFQLPNPGFEAWESGGNTAEPQHWNSFATADGNYASLASSPHHYRRNGHRPGGDGSHYLTIYTKSVLFAKANGNMTTGCIHVGAATTNSNENYNYTDRSRSAHCQPFTATPDSLYVWVSFYAASSSSQAQITAILHGDSDFKSPNQDEQTGLYSGKAQARFTRTTSSASQMQWQQIKVPFNYNGTAEPHYMLVNMTTNRNPGEGSANDSLSIDDIEFIYSAWLDNIALNGNAIEGFERGVLGYSAVLPDTAALAAAVVTAVPQAADASVDIATTRLTDSTALVTIDVTAEDGVTVRHYTVALSAPMPIVLEPGQYSVTLHMVDRNGLAVDNLFPECFVTGAGIYDEGQTVTVSASGNFPLLFDYWLTPSGDTIVDNPYSFVIDSNVVLTAVHESHVGVAPVDGQASSLSVYPNPATATLAVEGTGELTLIDMRGRRLITATAPTTLDISSLPAGIYLLRCGGEVRRVIKMAR